HGWRGSRRQGSQPLARQHAVIVVAVTLRKLLVIRAGSAILTLVLRHASPPVHGIGNFVGGGIELNLLVKIFLGLLLAVLAIGEPSALPMRVRRFRSRGEAVMKLAIIINGAVIILAQQIHVSRGK